MSGATPSMGPAFRTFAQRIRHITNDGQVLIDAIFDIFQRARETGRDQIAIEAATWLADRGFGKPVQVGQLMDAEGNAVAFTLWSPATHEQAEVLTLPPREPEGEKISGYLPPAGGRADDTDRRGAGVPRRG